MRQSAIGALILMAISLTCTSMEGKGLVNGSFESWAPVKGMPPAGIPVGWTIASAQPYRAPGLVDGSNYSAFVPKASGALLFQNVTDGPVDYNVSFDLAALDPGSADNRSFNLQLFQDNSSKLVLNLRLVQGSEPGMLSLQAYNGGKSKQWETIAENAMKASTYNTSSNTFGILNVYRLSLTTSFTTSPCCYAISITKAGDEPLLIENVAIFQIQPSTSGSLTRVAFVTSSSSAGFAVDNVSLEARP